MCIYICQGLSPNSNHPSPTTAITNCQERCWRSTRRVDVGRIASWVAMEDRSWQFKSTWATPTRRHHGRWKFSLGSMFDYKWTEVLSNLHGQVPQQLLQSQPRSWCYSNVCSWTGHMMGVYIIFWWLFGIHETTVMIITTFRQLDVFEKKLGTALCSKRFGMNHVTMWPHRPVTKH